MNNQFYSRWGKLPFWKASIWAFVLLFNHVSSELKAQSPTTVAGLFSRTLTNGNLAVDKDGNPIDMTTGATVHLAALSPASGTTPSPSNATNIAWPAGFSFVYPTNTASAQVVSWSVATNGCMGLSNTATSAITSGNNIAGGAGFRMGSFITGLNNGGVSESGAVRSKVFGVSPNQVFVVEFDKLRFVNTSTNTNGDITHQVRFYENGNLIEFVYGDMALGAGSSTTVRAGFSTNSAAAENLNINFSNHTVPNASFANTFNVVGPLAPFAGATATTRRVYQFSPTPFPQQLLGTSFVQFASSVPVGGVNQTIARLEVVTTGTATPLDLTAIQLSTAGTNASAISNLKVFYTGSNPGFSDTAQFGSTIVSPAANNTVTGSRTMLAGSNFFWVTYDIPSTATFGDTVRAVFGNVTLAGINRTPVLSGASAFRIVRLPLSGTFTVGNGAAYPNLGAAFADVNSLGLSGNTSLAIVSNITEPVSAVLNQWTEVGVGGYTLTIRPAGASRVISGNVPSSGIISLVGADRVVIDGRLDGIGNSRDLTIRNDNNTAINVAVLIAGVTTAPGGCNDVTIRNCVLMAGPTLTTSLATAGIQAQGTGAPNNNLVITNNEFKRAFRGVFVGTSVPASPYLGLQITNNVFGSNDPTEYVIHRGIQVNQSRSAVIRNNHIFNVINALSVSNAGIEVLTGSDSATISANRIIGVRNPSTAGFGAYGINLGAGNGHLVVNNDVSDITTTNFSATSTAFNAFGIRIAAGTGHRIYHNTVNMSGAYTGTNTTAGAASLCITAAAVTAELRNNNFSNTITSNATGNKNIFALWLPASYVFANLTGTNNNNYFLGSEPYHIFAQRGTTFATNTIADLAAWQTASSVDANSVAVNPRFFAPNSGVPNATAMNNLGASIAGIPTDLTGATRSATTPDLGAYEYTPITKDMAAISLARAGAGCFGTAESIRAIVRNTGLDTLFFGTDTLRVSVSVTGAVNANLNATRSSGFLAPDDTLHVLLGPVNLMAFGSYSVNGIIIQQNDGVASNNAFGALSLQNVIPTAIPFAADFDGPTGTTIGALLNQGWTIATPWIVGANGHGNTGNGLYVNIYNTANNLTPSFTLPITGQVAANTGFAFDYRLVNWSGYGTATQAAYAPGPADSIWFDISADCGSSYQRLYTINATTHVVDTNWVRINLPLAAYAGQNVIIRLRSQWASGDYFLDLDNLSIQTQIPTVITAELRSRSTTSVVIAASHNNPAFQGTMGVVYGTTPNPTMLNNNYWDANANNNLVARVEGLLLPGTTYYARAYTQTHTGQISYSNELEFKTFGGMSPTSVSPTFIVENPTNLAGSRFVGQATNNSGWGFVYDTLAVRAPLVIGRSPQTDSLGCEGPLLNASVVSGKIAVVYRGACEFGAKALAAYQAGAVGVVIINNQPGMINLAAATFGSQVPIPVVMISAVDGAQLRAAIDNGQAMAFMGNKNGEFAIDLVLIPSELVGPDATHIVSAMASQPGQYITPMGAYVYNAGKDPISQYYLQVSVLKDVAGQNPQQVYNNFLQLPPSILPGDFGLATMPAIDWGGTNFGAGNYTIRYNVQPWSGATEGFPQDNVVERRFSITDSIYSKSTLDSTGAVIFTTGNRPMGAADFGGAVWLDYQGNATRRVNALRFGFTTNAGVNFAGELVEAQVLRWDDTNNDGEVNGNETTLLGSGSYTLLATDANRSLQVDVQNSLTGAPGVDIVPGNKYLLGVYYYGSNQGVFLASDPSSNYAGTTRNTTRLISSTNANGTGWNKFGFGPQIVFAIAAVIGEAGPANTSITGVVTYDNNASTPMNNTMVMLFEQQNMLQQTMTDGAGMFDFGLVPPGSYTVRAFTTKAWGGVNSTDALAIARHFTSAAPLAGLRLDAADVNASETVNATDALQVARRFTNQINSFALGDWVFKADGFTHTVTQPTFVNMRALAVGDVNGSYIPGNFRRSPLVALQENGSVRLGSEARWITVEMGHNLELGAVSLDMLLPQGVEVLQVKSRLAGGDFGWNVKNGVLLLSWYSLLAVDAREGSPVVDLLVRSNGAVSGSWQAGSESELANGWAEVHGPAQLRLPRLVDDSKGLFVVQAYPNPTKEAATLSLNLPDAGKVSIRITDALGRLVYERYETQAAGSQQMALPSEKWAAGSYQITVMYEGATSEVQQLRLQVVR